MSAVPLSETTAKRRIGDILLAHGFVTAEEIAEATLEQERTQQPLGQILVGRGSITRLELASALAEQWSEPAASISSPPRAAPSPAPAPSAQDEAHYAARLQEAVADLARKVQSNTPLDGIDERVGELSRRIESTLARTQHIEAAVATLAESLEGVATGVEEAFLALQTSTADLVGDLARLEQTVGEIAARELPQAEHDGLAEIEELKAAVAEVREGTAGASELRERVGELAGRLEALADPQRAVQDVSERVEEVAAQLDALNTTRLDEIQGAVRDLEGQARLFDELRTAVGELQERPVGMPDLDQRLERLEAELAASSSGQTALATQIDALDARLSEQKAVELRVDDVAAQLESLESRLDGTTAGVEEVRATLALHDDAAVLGRVDDLAQALETLRGEIADAAASSEPDRAVVERLDTLSARLEELARETGDSAELVARVGALETRLADGVVTPDALTRSIEWAMSELPEPVADERLASLSTEVAALRADLASLTDAGDRLGGDDERVASLEARLDALAHEHATGATLATRLGEMEEARAGDLDTIDVLARAIDRMRHDLTTRPSAGDDPSEVTDALVQLAQRIDALEERPVAPETRADQQPELAAELERSRRMLERIGLHLGEHDRALADLAPIRGAAERLDELTALVHDLALSQQAALAPKQATAASPPSGDVGALLQRVEQAEAASQADNEKLLNRLERMASSIDWRLQRLEADDNGDVE